MPKKPQLLGSSIEAKSRLFEVEGLHLKFSNGVERHFERIKGIFGRGSVMIVPMLDDQTVLLIREYAAGLDDYVLGFPKGAVESGEDLLKTANRELMEEVGYGAKDLTRLTRMSASPGYLASMMDIILARDLYPSPIEGDEPEPIEVIPWSLNQIDQLLAHPEFREARSIAALLWIERKFHA